MLHRTTTTMTKYSQLATTNTEEENGNDGDLELSFVSKKQPQEEEARSVQSREDEDTLLTKSPDGDEDVLQKQQEEDDEGKRALQLWRLDNLAVPLCYLMVGLVQGLIYPLLNIYPLDLGATEAQQQTIWFLKGLPSSFKIVFGILSDNVAIFGYRRKPYMMIGWSMAMLCMMMLLLSPYDLSLERVTSNLATNATTAPSNDSSLPMVVIPPENAPSIPFLSGIVFLWANGVWVSDVMGDSLVAEKAKYETQSNRGNLQAICYCLRGFGMALMAPISSVLYSQQRQGPAIIISAAAMLPVLLFPFMYHLRDSKMIDTDGNNASRRRKEHLKQFWDTACSQAVWQPMGFVYIYMAFFVSNAAWREFLKSVLGFTPNQLNALLLVAGVLAFCGLVVYKFFLMQTSWRYIFIAGILISGLFSALQLLLIWNQIPFGLSPFLFSLGDDGVRDFLLGTHYLPICVMMVNLVPSGIEGASYALFTTTWNVAGTVSDALSTVLLRVWDVSKENLVQGDLSGLVNLTILTTVLQMIPMLFVGFIPHSVEDLRHLQRRNDGNDSSTSSLPRLGGTVYLSLVILSIVFAVFIGVMNVVRPGWMGES